MSATEQRKVITAEPPPLAVLSRTATVAGDRRLSLEIELPPDCPTGDVEVTLTIRQGVPVAACNRFAELRDAYAGQIWMSPDFDEPLEEFKEYR